jgi:hypothetical protein
MKSKIGFLAGMALAMGGVAQSAVPVQQDNKNSQHVQTKAVNNQRKVVQSREIKVDPMTGGLDFNFYDLGRSPKEYGQYLMSRGLQKWNKRK